MFNQEEAKFLLESVFERSVSTKMGEVVNGLRPSPLVDGVVKKLRDLAGLNEPVATSEAPKADVPVVEGEVVA